MFMNLSDETIQTARLVAHDVSKDDPELEAELERQVAGTKHSRPPQFPTTAEVVSVAGLILSVAQFAWTIYKDLKAKQKPSEAALVLQIETQFPWPHHLLSYKKRISASVARHIQKH
jgi:hypothetical protein